MGDVVVVGSLNYDLCIFGAPLPRDGETVAAREWRPRCGGKGGNQAVEAARHGARVAMVGAVGSDPLGDGLLANLERLSIDVSAVRRVAGSSGIAAILFDARNDQRIIVVPGANAAVLPDTLAADAVRRARVLVLQNEIPLETNRAAAALAREVGAAVMWNAAPAVSADAAMLALTDILVVNQTEAEMFGAAPVLTLADAAAAARVAGRMVRTAIVTAGSAGLAVATAGGVHTLDSHTVTVASTLAAGDCFCGALAARLAAGEELAAAVLYANAAAAVLVATAEDDRERLTVADARARLALSAPLVPA